MPSRIRPSGARRVAEWLILAALAAGIANAAVFGYRAALRLADHGVGDREAVCRQVADVLSTAGVTGGTGILLVDDRYARGGAGMERLAFEMRLRHDAYPMRWRVVRVSAIEGGAAHHIAAGWPDAEDASAIVTYRVVLPAARGWQIRSVGPATVAVRALPRQGRVPSFDFNPVTRGVRLGIAFGVVYGLGAVVLGLFRLPPLSWPLRLALNHLAGTVCIVWVATVGMAVTGRLAVWPVYAAAGAAVLLRYVRRPRGAALTDHPCPEAVSGHSPQGGHAMINLLSGAAIAIGTGVALLQFAGTGLSWDGWSIWEMKARALFYDSAPHLLADPAYDFTHRDYPLAVPLRTWWLYAHYGAPVERIAQAAGLVFLADAALLARALAATCARKSLACSAGLAAAGVVLTQPTMMRHASSGYADVPFAASMLAVVWSADALMRGSGARGWALLTGLCAAGCAATKNEGLPLAVMMFSIGALWVWRAKASVEWRIRARLLGVGACTFLCILLPWWGLAASLGLRGDLIGGGRYPIADEVRRSTPVQDSLAGQPRSAILASSLVRTFTAVGPAYPAWGLAWVLAAVGIASALTRHGRLKRLPILTAGLMLVTYMVVLARSHHPLDWHLSTSLDRLLMQILPLAVAAGCCAWGSMGLSQPGRVINEDRGQAQPALDVRP